MKRIYVIAGTNGAGKSSAACFIISESINYFNPDQMVKAFQKKIKGPKTLMHGNILLKK